MGISVGATEHPPALTEPNGHRDLDAISTQWRRIVELFESIVENLDIALLGLASNSRLKASRSGSSFPTKE